MSNATAIYLKLLRLFFMSRLVQVIVAGKLRAQRAKAMKFRDGYMIKSGRVREGEFLFAVSAFSLLQSHCGIRLCPIRGLS